MDVALFNTGQIHPAALNSHLGPRGRTRSAYPIAVVLSLLLVPGPLLSSQVQSAHGDSAYSWNPVVSCAATLDGVRDVLGSSYPSQSLTGSRYQTSSTSGGVPNKRAISPPCTITSTSGQTVPSLVQISGVWLESLTSEDCSNAYNAVNGGGSYPDRNGDGVPDTYCDTNGNMFQVGTTSGYIHIEIDHDWKATGYCGAGTFCDDSALANDISSGSISLDVQGFVYWDVTHWELHPLTAWKLSSTPPPGPQPLSTSLTYSPSVPSPGITVSFSATATGGISPYAFSWTFADGTSATGSSPTHVYSSQGSYNVTLTANDSNGHTAKSSKIVSVKSQVSYTFSPTDDATVDQSNPGTNYGSSPQIIVDASPVRNMLLKFNVQVPGQVTGATLRLFQVDSSDRGGDFHTASANWTESTVTWNNAPPASPTTFFSLGAVVINAWYSVDMTSVVTGNGIVSLRATSPSTDGSYFSSKEGVAPPQLIVNVTSNSPLASSFTYTPSSPLTNQAVTFTATASGGAPPYSFSWDLGDGGSATGSSVTHMYLATGSYNVTLTAHDSVGHTVTVSKTVTIGPRATSTNISCPASANLADPAICTASVQDTSLGTAATPTGTVTWTHSDTGSFNATTCSLSSGGCAVTYTPMIIGSHEITGGYGGDATHVGSSGSTTIAVGVHSTTTSLSCTPRPATLNQASTCTATVTDISVIGAIAPTGTVTFTSSGVGSFNGSPCTLGILTDTSAGCSVSYTPTAGSGTHTITGTYNPDLAHAGSLGKLDLTVTLRTTSTSVTCPSTGTVGVAMTCSAIVHDTSPGTMSSPTGSVTFTPGGSCILASGLCSVSISPTVAGAFAVSGSYNGDPSHDTSNGSTTVTVSKRATSIVISCSPNPVANYAFTSCTPTVTDTDASTVVTPTGGVSFASNSTGGFSTSSCVLASTGSAGVASCMVGYTPSLTGHHAISSTYGGDSAHTGSSGSATLTVILSAPPAAYALVVSYEGKVFRYQNGSLTLIGQPVTTGLRQVAWKPDGSYALIVGDFGVLIKYDGSQFTLIPTGFSGTTILYTVAWKGDGSYALIAGSSGLVLKYDGVSVSRFSDPNLNNLYGIAWNPTGSKALLVGGAGTVLLFQNNLIQPIASNTTSTLYAVAWNPNGLYAVIGGAGGAVLRYDGTSIAPMNTVGVYSSSMAVKSIAWNGAGSLALLVGDYGLVLSYDGTSLSQLPALTNNFLWSVSWQRGTATIVGGSCTLMTYTNGTLTKVAYNSLNPPSLRGIAWKPS